MGKVTGGQIVAQALEAQGVSHLFTLCGGHVQSIYDGCLDVGIRVVDVRHEQSAAHAADGWARVTGRPGVAVVTAGPGVTNAITGVANAQRAQVPMVLIGGAGPQALADRGSLQDMDHLELMRPVTKWAASPARTDRLAEYVQTAFRIAMSGVPGPVFLEMPVDLLMGSVSERAVVRYDGSFTDARVAGDSKMMDRAAEILNDSERPVAICGSQLRWSADEAALSRFVEAAQVPTFVSGMARGALPPEHPWLYTRCRRDALREADAIFVLGTPLDFRLGYGGPALFNHHAKIVQIDLDGSEIGRNRGVDVGIVGDLALIMNGLVTRLDRSPVGRVAWQAKLNAAETRRAAPFRAERNSDAVPPNPIRVLATLDRYLKEDTIVIGDGGDFVATAAYALRVRRPGLWMDPGPLGTLGVGPGFAMAAKLARPESDVVIVFGDGSVGFNGFELEAMARQGIKITAIVGNDACWRQIHRGQVQIYGEQRAVATRLAPTRYDLFAEAVGGHGELVEHPDQLDGALERAFASPKPALVNVMISESNFRKGSLSV